MCFVLICVELTDRFARAAGAERPALRYGLHRVANTAVSTPSVFLTSLTKLCMLLLVYCYKCKRLEDAHVYPHCPVEPRRLQEELPRWAGLRAGGGWNFVSKGFLLCI